MKNFEPVDWIILAFILALFGSLIAGDMAKAWAESRNPCPCSQHAKP